MTFSHKSFPGLLLCGALLACAPALAQEAPHAHASAATAINDHGIAGVWEPLGGALMNPADRGRPENANVPMPEVVSFPPYNAEYQARYDAITARLRTGERFIDGSTRCLPQGMPRMMIIGYPIDISVQSNRVVMMFEPGAQRRIIYTDGRQHPEPDLIDPTYSGDSIGHWEGDTLVVSTTGIREDLYFDYTFPPHSDALSITERIRREGDTLINEMVLDDPKAFTQPWRLTRTYRLQPDWELKEFVCDPTAAE